MKITRNTKNKEIIPRQQKNKSKKYKTALRTFFPLGGGACGCSGTCCCWDSWIGCDWDFEKKLLLCCNGCGWVCDEKLCCGWLTNEFCWDIPDDDDDDDCAILLDRRL